jgi:hypothetical protein
MVSILDTTQNDSKPEYIIIQYDCLLFIVWDFCLLYGLCQFDFQTTDINVADPLPIIRSICSTATERWG